jgi:hypothetical protein
MYTYLYIPFHRLKWRRGKEKNVIASTIWKRYRVCLRPPHNRVLQYVPDWE